MITVTRVVLLCALISVALTASVLAPIVSPSVAEVNSHSVRLNVQSGSSPLLVNLTVGQTFNVTIYQDGEPTKTCMLIVNLATPINDTEGVISFWFGKIINGSCTVVNP